MSEEISQSHMIGTWLIPLLIFIARLMDMTLDTIRVIYVTRGSKYIAATLGFIQTLIWVFAISQVVQNLGNIWNAFSFSAGFAAGTFVGIWLEGKLAIGKVLIQIITRKDASELIERLKSHGYSLTTTDGEGPHGKVKIIFTVIQKKYFVSVNRLIQSLNPKAFVSISEVKEAREDYIPSTLMQQSRPWIRLWRR